MTMNKGNLEFSAYSLEEIVAMQPEQKLAVIKDTLYSEDNLLKIVVKIMVVVDPESVTKILDWVKSKSAGPSALG